MKSDWAKWTAVDGRSQFIRAHLLGAEPVDDDMPGVHEAVPKHLTDSFKVTVGSVVIPGAPPEPPPSSNVTANSLKRGAILTFVSGH